MKSTIPALFRSRLSWILPLGAVFIFSLFHFERVSVPSVDLDALSLPWHPRSTHILIVTAYFPLPGAKHSLADYDAWLENFMGNIQTDMYIFCPPVEEAHLRGLIDKAASGKEGGDRRVYFDTQFSSPFDTPVLAAFTPQKDVQHSLDPEQFHIPELYAVWSSKPYFVGEANRRIGQSGRRRYKYYVWQDAGAMRQANTLKMWPGMERMDEVFATAERRRHWQPTRFHDWRERAAGKSLVMFPFLHYANDEAKAWTFEQGTLRHALNEGSFFGGTGPSLLWFEKAFYEMFDTMLAAGHFVGRDLDTFNALMSQYPTHFFGPIADEHRDILEYNSCGDQWFYYIQWLASDEERKSMEDTFGWKCPLVPVDFPFLSLPT